MSSDAPAASRSLLKRNMNQSRNPRYDAGLLSTVNTKDIFPTIIVSQSELTLASKRLKRSTTLRSLKIADMGIRLVDGNLILEIPGGSDGAPAIGNWPGLLLVSAKVLLLFANGEPRGDEIQLSYHRGRLTITDGKAKINYPAEWEATSLTRIEVALDSSNADYLKVASQYPLAQVISSGLENAAFAADKKFQSAVDKAYQAVKAFGIQRADLETTLRSMIVKRT